MAADGPLKLLLRRFNDRAPRIWIQRWKPDHPVTISLTIEELDDVEAMIAAAREQIGIAANSEGRDSTLDLKSMVRLARGDVA